MWCFSPVASGFFSVLTRAIQRSQISCHSIQLRSTPIILLNIRPIPPPTDDGQIDSLNDFPLGINTKSCNKKSTLMPHNAFVHAQPREYRAIQEQVGASTQSPFMQSKEACSVFLGGWASEHLRSFPGPYPLCC